MHLPGIWQTPVGGTHRSLAKDQFSTTVNSSNSRPSTCRPPNSCYSVGSSGSLSSPKRQMVIPPSCWDPTWDLVPRAGGGWSSPTFRNQEKRKKMGWGKDNFNNRPKLSLLIKAKLNICHSVNPGVQFEAYNLLRASLFLRARWMEPCQTLEGNWWQIQFTHYEPASWFPIVIFICVWGFVV